MNAKWLALYGVLGIACLQLGLDAQSGSTQPTRLVQGVLLTSDGQPAPRRVLLFVVSESNFCSGACSCDESGKCGGGGPNDACKNKFCYNGVISRTNAAAEFRVALADAQYNVYAEQVVPENRIETPVTVKEGAQLKGLTLRLPPPRVARGAQ